MDCTQSCDEKLHFYSPFARSMKLWLVRLRCELRLTWPCPVRSMRSDCLSATTWQPCRGLSTGSVKPRSFHGAFNQTKGFHICTDTCSYLALAIQAPLSQQKSFAENKLFAVNIHATVRSKAQGEKRHFFAHASCTAQTRARRLLVRGFARNFSCSGNQASMGNAETNQRLGMSVTPAMWIQCSLASPSEDSSEKGNQSLDFPHFATFVHTLLMGSSPSRGILSGTETKPYGLLPMLSTNR